MSFYIAVSSVLVCLLFVCVHQHHAHCYRCHLMPDMWHVVIAAALKMHTHCCKSFGNRKDGVMQQESHPHEGWNCQL